MNRRRAASRPVVVVLGIAAAAVAIVTALVYSGLYNVAASSPHRQFVYELLETVMKHSVRLYASGHSQPPIDERVAALRGAACFRDHCVQCHGAPGIAPGHFGLGMNPDPGPLVDVAHKWKLREIYWITSNGIKMTGMPAWQYRLGESDLWAVSAFVARLPAMSPQDYAEQARLAQGEACGEGDRRPVIALEGNPARGERAVTQYGCRACHMIPGVPGPEVHVGPPLGDLHRRELLGGRLPSTTEHLVRWIRFPREVDPLTAMPDLDISEADARDIAAFLLGKQ